MNRISLMKKTAVSAIALLAVAAQSAFADPANVTPPGATGGAPLVVSADAVQLKAAYRLVDPAELAKTYAPDTADDWKQALDRYRELAGAPQTIALDGSQVVRAMPIGKEGAAAFAKGSLTQATLAPAATDSLSDIALHAAPGKWTNATGIGKTGLAEIRKPELADAGKSGLTAAGKSGFAEASKPGLTAAGKEADQKLKLGTATLKDATPTTAVAVKPIGIYPIDYAELAEAAESKDADAIRDALAGQLDALRAQIAELSAAADRAK